MEWLGGAIYNGRYLLVRVGYADSTGLHGSLESPQLGLYANGVIRNEGGLTAAQYEVGLGDWRCLRGRCPRG